MTAAPGSLLVLVESNTSGTGRLLVAAARARKLRAVLLSTRPDRYPWVEDDGVEVAWADTTDPEAVAQICARLGRRSPLAGVTTTSEYFVATAARAAARLGLPGPDAGAVDQCREKRRQRLALCQGDVPVPAFEAVGSATAAVAAAAEIGLPVVCKPADGTGSRGVRLCSDLDAVAAHARRLLSHRRDERGAASLPWILVEEYVDGPEFSVETLAGEVVGETVKHVGPLPHFVETGHDFPAHGPGLADVAATASRAVKTLGLDWGAAHTEVRMSATGPVVMEVNPRLAGGQIPVLINHATGLDLIAAMVDQATGSKPQLPPPGPGHASIRFLVAPAAGRLVAVDGRAEARRVPGVVDVAVTARPGDVVGGTGSFLDRMGWVITAGPERVAVRAAAEQALALLRPVVETAEVERRVG
ncbi:MAG: ATP-grasp domain-containing protein [Acidimicrobiia bacterium]